MGLGNSRPKSQEKVYSVPGRSFKRHGELWQCRRADEEEFVHPPLITVDIGGIAGRLGFDKKFVTDNLIEYVLGSHHRIVRIVWDSKNPHLIIISMEDTQKKGERIEEIDLTELIRYTKYNFNKKREGFYFETKDFGTPLEPITKKETTDRRRTRVDKIHNLYSFSVLVESQQIVVEPMESREFFLESEIDGLVIETELRALLRAEKIEPRPE